jgi:hypothetical protein
MTVSLTITRCWTLLSPVRINYQCSHSKPLSKNVRSYLLSLTKKKKNIINSSCTSLSNASLLVYGLPVFPPNSSLHVVSSGQFHSKDSINLISLFFQKSCSMLHTP